MEYAKLYKFLFTDERYCRLSANAKLLYCLLVDRFSLSEKNDYRDEYGKCFVYFTVKEAASLLNVTERSAGRLFAELISCALLCEQKEGKNRRLYPKIFTDIGEKNSKSHPKNFRPSKTEINNTEINNTELSHKNIINEEGSDPYLLEKIKENCELEIWYDGTGELLERVIENIYYSDSLKLNGRVLSQNELRKKLMRLTADSLIYAVDNMKRERGKITAPAKYLQTAILNSPDDYEAENIINQSASYQGEVNKLSNRDVFRL